MKLRLPPVFVDTSAWIDLFEGGKLRPFLEAAARGALGFGIAHTSDFVVLEAYSFIGRNHRKAAALRFLDLATGPDFYLHACGADVVDEAMTQARRRLLGRELSLVDWTTAILMEQHRVRHVLTADRGFGQLGFEVIP